MYNSFCNIKRCTFTIHESNLSCNKSSRCGFRKVVAVSKERFSFFQKNIVHVTRFTGPRQTYFASSDVNPSQYGVTPQLATF